MVLDAVNVVHYLLGRGLITRQSVVDGDLVVVDASRRNRNFKIQRASAPSFFVKQIRVWTPEAIASLQCEATCYRLAQSDAGFGALASLVPAFCDYDARNHVLVVELLTQSENLRERYQRVGCFSAEVGERLGTALGKYHAGVQFESSERERISGFAQRRPWILSFHVQQFDPGSLSSALSQLHSLLRQYPEFAQRLDELRETWQINCLIHGDMKWDNCLVYPRDVQDGRLNFKVVDWELADFGDACWDLGSILQAYLSSWVLSMPDTGVAPAMILIERAQYQLEDMQPAIRAFWQAYTTTRQIAAGPARDLLERSIRYGAARMVQTAYEFSMNAPQLTPFGVRLLQLSDNILANPQDAVEHLLAA